MPSSSPNIERYTPRWIFEGLDVYFDLDPCAPVGDCPSKAFCNAWYSLPQDGLQLPWEGSVWLNPPWTRGAKTHWLARLAAHSRGGIALVRGGADSRWLHEASPSSLFMFRGRVGYVRGDGQDERDRKGKATGGFEPSMLLGYGPLATEVLSEAKLNGLFCSSVEKHAT